MDPPRRDQAISPAVVITVVIIIITILIAMVGAFVFGGGTGESMPQATLEPTENPAAGSHGYVNVTISAGPTIDTSQLKARGASGLSPDAVTIQNNDSLLRAGDSIDIRVSEDAEPGDRVIIRWSASDGSQTRNFFEYSLSREWSR